MLNKKGSCTCVNCGKEIKFSAEEPEIGFKFCGGCPGYSVTITCPHCGSKCGIPQSKKNKKLLGKRLEDFHFPEAYK